MPDAAFPARSTPFPSHLLDDVMPVLSDTEWRVLCVVVRQTLGWEDGQGGRKREDWLTQSQLKARTGRASEAVSRAVDGLVQKGLIQVRSEAGELLSTPRERQRSPGKMLFGLAPHVPGPPEAAPNAAISPAPNALAQAQGLREETGSSESEEGSSQSEQGHSVSELRKANTTKETQDKTTSIGVQPDQRNGGDKAVENSGRSKAEPAAGKASEQGASNVRRFLQAYQEEFARHNARGEGPPLAWGRDGRLVKGLLAQYGYERLLELLTRFFQSEDAWVRKRGFALSCFPTLLPALLMEDGRPKEALRRAQTTPVVVHGPSARHWQQAGDSKASDTSLFERYPHLRDRARGQPP